MPINPEHHSEGTLRKHEVEMTERLLQSYCFKYVLKVTFRK